LKGIITSLSSLQETHLSFDRISTYDSVFPYHQ
jgi:hypothetical protein